jgi:hypothetical protein
MLASVPPFWTIAIAIFVLLFLMSEFPRAGGMLLVAIVLVMLLGARKTGTI